MRTVLNQPGSTLGSYLYQQYADDDDLQALVDSYNQAAQTFLDWFNQVQLPYYPGLSGDLLNWVARGLYGYDRTSLQAQISTALGPLNTVVLNTMVINGFIPGAANSYVLSDDFFQRMLTWHLYKGDGYRFCVRWLKRRVMRFLVGTNGVDPQPFVLDSNLNSTLNPQFVVGAENTSAISVQIASGVVTVSIDQLRLSGLASVSTGVLNLFKVAFTSGVLDLPAQFTYACNI